MRSSALRATVRVATLALVLGARSAMAQSPVALPNTVQREVTAKSNGTTYRLDIALPPGYDTTTRRYPVFLLLDGNLAFPLALETHTALALSGGDQALVLVGVGYPGSAPEVFTPQYSAARMRDYTPTVPKGAPPGTGGGAAAFLAFLKDELIPLLGRDYRIDVTDVGLGGHSLGGLFTTYALLHEPATFSKYWIGSPSLWWDAQVSFTYLDAPALNSTPPRGRAYVTVGADESDVMVPPMVRLAKELTSRFPTLQVGSQVFPDETHVSVVGASVSRAFRFLYTSYGTPTVTLSRADLAAFSGAWSGPQGAAFEIGVTNGKAQLSFTTEGQRITAPLVAASRDRLFSRAFNAEITAERDAKGKVVRLSAALLGRPMVYERAK